MLDRVYIDLSEDFDVSGAGEKTKLLSELADDVIYGYSHEWEVQVGHYKRSFH